MGTPSLRLRLVFKDRTILSQKQRSDGMNHSWLLIKPQLHKTIADVCTHLVHVFELNRSCPNGVLLTMEGFAFAPFESTEILNDKDIICVKKKGGATTDALEAEDEGNLLEEEVEDDGLENGNRDSPEQAVCKKRKASTNLQNLKKKKRCLGVLDDEDDTENDETEDLRKLISRKKLLNGNSKPNEETNKTAATSNKNLQSPTTAKRSEQHQENIEEVNQVSDAPGAKKMASRSSRRKQQKRRWKQELAKIAKKRPQAYSKPEVTKAGNKEANGHPKGLLHWKQASKNNVQNGDVGPIASKPGHIRFELSEEDQPAKQTRVSNETFNRNSSSSKRKGQKWGGREGFLTRKKNETKRISKESFKMLFKDAQVPVIDPNDFDKLPPCCEPKMASRSSRRKQQKRRWKQELAKIAKKRPQAYSKPEVTKAGNKEANGHPKGLLHWKQASKNNVQNGDVGPIASKPGHIRFELSEEDQPAKQTRVSNETFNRNSSSSKRKGQKWGGREGFLTRKKNETKRISKESFKMLFKDAQVPVIDPNDFDKLPPCCEPKEGDVIAYRLLELNSSWIPELSSFRVGRISYYDAKDIVLIPVPEYPIVLGDIKEDGPNESLYGEDGTLEINYSALVDVRNVEQYVPHATKAASNGVNQTLLSSDMDASENLVSNSNDNNTDLPKDSNPGNDGAAGPSTTTAGHGAAGPSTNTAGHGAAGPTTDPWLNANKPGPSEIIVKMGALGEDHGPHLHPQGAVQSNNRTKKITGIAEVLVAMGSHGHVGLQEDVVVVVAVAVVAGEMDVETMAILRYGTQCPLYVMIV
uniref:Uncharacterized protein n=1 Tax=Tanacetum cinerariifolium TaxID=118510 RepID=A0A6L2NEK0_TANCI|nr:hypothetical protein [Tanacetum cinerariifolium]